MARSINIEGLSPDECRVTIAMLNLVSEDCNHAGAYVESLGLPTAWLEGGARKALDLCEGLVARGIFLRQYGEAYRHYTHRGKVRDWGKVWYTFNESLFVRACELRKTSHFAALAAELAPQVSGDDLVRLLVANLQSVGRLVESESTKPIPKKKLERLLQTS